MKPFWKRREPRPTEEAREALEQTERLLKDVRAQAGEVEYVASQIEETLTKNHFGAAVARAMRGSHP